MINYSFSLLDLEYYLLILTRVTMFIFAAPFFSMNNTPRRVRIALAVFTSYVIYEAIPVYDYPYYYSVLSYATLVLKEAVVGLLIGLGGTMCVQILAFAGHIVDVEIGFSMASTMDPMTNTQTSVSGFLYQYGFMLIMIISGMYQYLLTAIADSFTLIPVGNAEFILNNLYKSFIQFMGDYIIIGFRIALPVFCTVLILNGVLGIMSKVAPQLNMFSVGLQLKALAGLAALFLSVSLIPAASNFIFERMKMLIVSFVEAMGGTV